MELKPCPFCGCSARMRRAKSVSETNYPPDTYWKVDCMGCGAVGASANTEKKAIEAWNMRADNG